MRVYIEHTNNNASPLEDEQKINIDDLMKLENASLNHISLNNSLDFVGFNQRGKVLKTAVKKLRYGGSIDLNGIDLMSLSKSIRDGIVNIQQANQILSDRLSTDNLSSVIKQVQSGGIQIEIAKLDDFNYYVKAKRPKI